MHLEDNSTQGLDFDLTSIQNGQLFFFFSDSHNF